MPDPTTTADTRTPKQLMTQWRKIAEIKRGLVRDGLADGNATPAELLEKIRLAVPKELFE